MFSLFNKMLLGASVVLSVALLALWWYLDIQLEVKASLEAKVKDKDMVIREQAHVLEMYEKNKQVVNEILIRNEEEKNMARRENSKLKIDLRRILERSKDECVDRAVDPAIIDRLRAISGQNRNHLSTSTRSASTAE
jgi:hypothetical protein